MKSSRKVQIVSRWLAGQSIWDIAFEDWQKTRFGPLDNLYERIIREFVHEKLKRNELAKPV